MSRSLASLLSLPIEIQDAIAARIPKAHDVLNFGRTCKPIFAIVATRHLAYRHIGPIRVDMTQTTGRFGSQDSDSESALWRDLVAHPDRTANVNSLHLKFDATISGCAIERISPGVTTAIGLMQSLSEVTLVDMSDKPSAPTREAHAMVWEALSRIACLTSLRVILHPGFNILFASELTKITSLTNLEISTPDHNRRSGEVQERLNSMLFGWVQKNPFLERLTLLLSHYTLNGSPLASISLPHLRSFSVEMRLASGTDPRSIEGFFRNHSHLVELHYDLSGSGSHTFDAYPLGRVTLPHLEKLSGSAEGVSCVLRDNVDLQNNLRCVENYAFDASLADKLDVSRICVLGFDRLGALSNVYRYRNLRRLRVDGEEAVLDEDIGYHRQLSPAEWARALAYLPLLEVFRGVPFLSDPGQSDDMHDRAAALCRLAPRLRFIDHWAEPNCAIRLTRSADADADSEDGVGWDVVSSVFADNSVDFRSS